jgi:hypothetical protein
MADNRSTRRTAAQLASAPRLPKPRQRRLDDLLSKGSEGRLSVSESAELESMLEHVDRQSFWMLARMLAQSKPSTPARSGGVGRQLARR